MQVLSWLIFNVVWHFLSMGSVAKCKNIEFRRGVTYLCEVGYLWGLLFCVCIRVCWCVVTTIVADVRLVLWWGR